MSTKRISINICFKIGILNGVDYFEMINKTLNFIPFLYRTSKFRNFKKYTSKSLNDIKKFREKDTVFIQSEDKKDRLHITHVVSKNPYTALYFTYYPESSFDIDYLLKLMNNPNFIVAYACDEEDEYFQSAEMLSDYNVKKKSHEGLPKYYDDILSCYKIDISKNPGRSVIVEGVRLMSCWRMWFGPLSFELLDKDRMLLFQIANKIEEIDNLIFVELYKDPFTASLEENRKIQQAFRDWMKFDELEKKYK